MKVACGVDSQCHDFAKGVCLGSHVTRNMPSSWHVVSVHTVMWSRSVCFGKQNTRNMPRTWHVVSIHNVTFSEGGVFRKPRYQRHAEELACGVDSYCHVVANRM